MVSVWEIVFVPLLLAALLAYLLSPVVSYLEKQGVSRTAGIIIVYLVLILLFSMICLTVFPSLLKELKELASALPEYTETISRLLEDLERDYRRFQLPLGIRAAVDENLREIQKALTINLEKLTGFLLALFTQAFSLLLVPLFSFYFLRDATLIKAKFVQMFPLPYRQKVEMTLEEINKTMGAYLRGIALISLSVGFLIYIGLLILKVEFALFLGVVNALTDIIPYFGPILGALPVVLVALLQSPELVWKVILLIIVVQQVESQFIAPQLLGRSLGFHPLTVIIAVLLGGKFLGFAGMVLVVPFIALIRIIFRHFYPLLLQVIRKNE